MKKLDIQSLLFFKNSRFLFLVCLHGLFNAIDCMCEFEMLSGSLL